MKNIKTANKYSWIDNSIIMDNDYSGWFLQINAPKAGGYVNPSVGYVSILDHDIFNDNCKLFYWADADPEIEYRNCFVCQKTFSGPMSTSHNNNVFHILFNKDRLHYIGYIMLISGILLCIMVYCIYKMLYKKHFKNGYITVIQYSDSDIEDDPDCV